MDHSMKGWDIFAKEKIEEDDNTPYTNQKKFEHGVNSMKKIVDLSIVSLPRF
jgi:hypothetical protein